MNVFSNPCDVALLHGLAFFALGFSITFLARRSARLEIARGLWLLAAFGFCEALVAWSPMWFSTMAQISPSLPAMLRLLLLGAGYALLLAFALQTQAPAERRQWRRWLPAVGLITLWLAGLAVAYLGGVGLDRLCLGGEILARYGLALPGGILAAWGLRRQVYHVIESERLLRLKRPMRVARVGMGAFGVFGGIIGPAASFFPVNVFNEDLLLQTIGVSVSLLRGVCGVVITYGIVRALRVFLEDVEAWLEDVERRQALAGERERIGRELHDGTIQSIYAAGLMLEGAIHSISGEPEIARSMLERAIKSLNQTIQDIRRYIFDLRGHVSDDDVELGLRKMLADFKINTLLATGFSVEGEDPGVLTTEQRRHVFQIVREALTNAARHAQARRVEVALRHDEDAMRLSISDDGIGLSALPIAKGQGLRNIRERARLLGGSLDMHSAPSRGVTLVLTVPY